MTGVFEKALSFVLTHEGGFVDHPDDPGGATNRGITLATYRHWARRHGHDAPDVAALRAISAKTVRSIYHDDYWRTCRAAALPPHLGFVTFDMAVNAGPSRAVRLLQDAIGVSVDGVIGEQTLDAASSRRGDQSCFDELTARRLNFYGRLPTFRMFGLGWTRRTIAAHRAAEALAPWAMDQAGGMATSGHSPHDRAGGKAHGDNDPLWRRLWRFLT